MRLKDPWPPHSASQDDVDDVIEPLLALGYSVGEPSNSHGVQPLHVAAKYGRTAVATALLRFGADVNALATRGSETSRHNGQRPLDIARGYDSTGVADLLVRHGGTASGEGLAAWRRQRSATDDPLKGELRMTIESNDRAYSSVISEAIRNGDPNYEIPSESNALGGHRVLYAAVMQGYMETVRELLRLGANATARVSDRHVGMRTALHVAAQYGRASIVETLVQDGGLDVDAVSANNETALCVAVDLGLVRMTQAFLRLGANTNVFCLGERRSLLLFAKKAIIADELLRHGADVEARDSTPNYEGYTALLHAAARGHVNVVRSLLNAGADIEAKCDVRGNAPLYGAAVNNHPKVVELLLAHDAIVSPVNDDGWTPLGTAASSGYLRVAKALVRAGADPERWLSETIMESPAELAAKRGHHDVVAAMAAAKTANPWHSYSETCGTIVVAVLTILGFACIP